LYAGLTFFFVQALGGRKVNGTLAWGPYWIALLGASVYGAFDEWHQWFVPGRNSSAGDVLLNLVGSIGMLCFLRLRALQRARA